MIFQLFLNGCILVTFISLSYLFLKDRNMDNDTSITLRVLIGLSAGGLGIILLINGVQITPNIIIDFRYIPILLTAIYIGSLPAVITSIVIGVFRVLYFGVSEPSIVALIVVLVVGIGFGIIARFKVSIKERWISSILFLFFVAGTGSLIAMKATMIFLKFIITFYISNMCLFWIIYIYTEYLKQSIEINNKLKNEATKDFLTGLNNVRQFDSSFNSISELTLRKQEKLSLLFIDIDFFKKINDTYGHNIGDVVLRGLAEVLVDTVRAFDIVSRNGGEEFSILLLDCSSDRAVEIAERLRKKVEEHKFNISDKLDLNITVSVGVSTYSDTTDKIDNLLEDADKALYEAKRTGRNKVVLYKQKDTEVIN